MAPQEAAGTLAAELRNQPWLTTVGVGLRNGRTVLFLYVNSKRDTRLASPPSQWEGFPVVIEKMANLHPA